MLDSLKFLDDLKLENFDLASLKIPKNAIYLMIAFKLINNLDKIVPQLKNLGRPNIPIPMTIPRPISNPSSVSLLVVFLLIGGAIILANNILDRVNISLMSCGVGALKDSNLKMPDGNNPIRKIPILGKCPIFSKCPIDTGKCPIDTGKCPIDTGKCPIRKCPILGKCPMKKKGILSCPLFSNDIEKKLMELMEENDKLQEELSENKKKNIEDELLENTE